MLGEPASEIILPDDPTVKQFMTRFNLTQHKMAAMCGKSQTGVRSWYYNPNVRVVTTDNGLLVVTCFSLAKLPAPTERLSYW